ncbi:hypothetical protein [Bradyrhizobium sp.]|uniref:hypothetical protein n=1 Tax=Bradyrhizobium sp. TaxID=376 RepID=UPI001D64EABB|nr:hypothetical protein [Bradyrhizobium sp.]MBI5323397.1 hypothetical protein [Bradyrhizobium sp.]
MITFHRPQGPECQTAAILARMTPGRSGFDARTLKCPAYGYDHQTAVEPFDPMKSRETNGWLMGQLRAPT